MLGHLETGTTAPRFHFLVWGIAFLHHQRLARRWFEIVGSNDPRHLAAGTRVEAVRSRNGVMRYASKLYMGKDFEMPPGWEHVGRFWGIIGRADLPLSACETFVEPLPVMIRFRRIVRRFLRAKGFTRRGRGCGAVVHGTAFPMGAGSGLGVGHPACVVGRDPFGDSRQARRGACSPKNTRRSEEGAQPSSPYPIVRSRDRRRGG